MEDWQTPDDLWNALNLDHGFDLDPCAPKGYERPVKFYTIDDDGLSKPWNGIVFCNPPWSEIQTWLTKGWEEFKARRSRRIVWLLPSRTGTAWWLNFYTNDYQVIWIRGKFKFKGAKHNCPEYCCLWIWG